MCRVHFNIVVSMQHSIQKIATWVEPMISFRSYLEVNKKVKRWPNFMLTLTNFPRRSRRFFLSQLMWRRCRRGGTKHCIQNVIGSSTVKSLEDTGYHILLEVVPSESQNSAIKETIVLLLQSKTEQPEVEAMRVILELEAVVVVVQKDKHEGWSIVIVRSQATTSTTTHYYKENRTNHFDLLM